MIARHWATVINIMEYLNVRIWKHDNEFFKSLHTVTPCLDAHIVRSKTIMWRCYWYSSQFCAAWAILMINLPCSVVSHTLHLNIKREPINNNVLHEHTDIIMEIITSTALNNNKYQKYNCREFQIIRQNKELYNISYKIAVIYYIRNHIVFMNSWSIPETVLIAVAEGDRLSCIRHDPE